MAIKRKPVSTRPPVKSHLVNALAHSRGPLNRLRSRRYGLDTLLGKAPALEFYYEPGDPHSHLTAQVLALLRPGLKAPVRIFPVLQEESVIYPELERQRQFALDDARRVAPAYGLSLPAATEPVASDRRFAACQLLLRHSDNPDAFLRAEADLSERLFRGEPLDLAGALTSHETHDRLKANHARRQQLGHYLPAMWQFQGEWFWGVDRLPHLLERLRERGLYDGENPVHLQPERAALGEPADAQTPLEFFFSFRSPYSYLAAVQLQKLLPTLQRPLHIKPVLPMAMRGLKVPLAKRLYILRDTAREAERLGIPFGLACDPIGAGALHCLKTFPLTQGTQQQLDFLVSAGAGAWSEAIDLASDAGLRQVTERAGLDWNTVQTAVADNPIDYAEHNRNELFAAGCWGVPSFRLGQFASWGRDRLWMMEELMRRSV